MPVEIGITSVEKDHLRVGDTGLVAEINAAGCDRFAHKQIRQGLVDNQQGIHDQDAHLLRREQAVAIALCRTPRQGHTHQYPN